MLRIFLGKLTVNICPGIVFAQLFTGAAVPLTKRTPLTPPLYTRQIAGSCMKKARGNDPTGQSGDQKSKGNTTRRGGAANPFARRPVSPSAR
ncbi:hypothetical protein D3OALGA1CA_3999 [Olavius algarvensis associated proteobacterium Delta 3]|nr:hypothetical protein D3OALGA1CA_3999 [Olavius algarvensis associated proteobacterium Delta 3]